MHFLWIVLDCVFGLDRVPWNLETNAQKFENKQKQNKRMDERLA